jgi:V/A-type H+-transporting ATPase subunit E
MSTTANGSLDALEDAIMARANELAQEFQDKAVRQRDTILRDAAERLHLAEEREVLIAKAEAERHYRRVTQASELRMQSRLDQLRWEMVQTVQSRLAEKMERMRQDQPTYRSWLITMLADASTLLPEGELHAEANAEDLSWLAGEWDAIVAAAAPDRVVTLNDTATWGSGGLKVKTADKRAQVDNTFEGRLERYQSRIQRVILKQLFPNDIHAIARSGGPQ